jgi:dCTP deaminase
MILSDRDILSGIEKGTIQITPFIIENLQPASIDITLAPMVRVFDNYEIEFVDIKQKIDPSRKIILKDDQSFIIHPGDFILGSTVEKVTLPNNLAAKIEGRSSLGRLGLIIHATAGYVDPGFSGNLTLEISNISRLPIKLYPHMRIAQITFEIMSSEVINPYGSSKLGSKYQGQIDPTSSKMWEDFSK